MSEQEFWDSTLRGLTLKAEGHQRAEQKKHREAWERARWLAAAMLQPWAPKGKRLKVTDIAEFPWEKEKKQEGLTDAQMKIFKKWDAST